MRLPIFPAVPTTITASNLIIQSQIDMLKSKLKYAAFMRKAKGGKVPAELMDELDKIEARLNK